MCLTALQSPLMVRAARRSGLEQLCCLRWSRLPGPPALSTDVYLSLLSHLFNYFDVFLKPMAPNKASEIGAQSHHERASRVRRTIVLRLQATIVSVRKL